MVPNPRTPGVSIIHPSLWGNGYISENVVVCMPVSCTSEMQAVLRSSPGIRRFMSVDLPTPEFPAISVILPCSSLARSSMPVPEPDKILKAVNP